MLFTQVDLIHIPHLMPNQSEAFPADASSLLKKKTFLSVFILCRVKAD